MAKAATVTSIAPSTSFDPDSISDEQFEVLMRARAARAKEVLKRQEEEAANLVKEQGKEKLEAFCQEQFSGMSLEEVLVELEIIDKPVDEANYKYYKGTDGKVHPYYKGKVSAIIGLEDGVTKTGMKKYKIDPTKQCNKDGTPYVKPAAC